jgi:hypothetical protein
MFFVNFLEFTKKICDQLCWFCDAFVHITLGPVEILLVVLNTKKNKTFQSLTTCAPKTNSQVTQLSRQEVSKVTGVIS